MAETSTETSTETLKAENARLQEQLSALLFRDANKAGAQKSETTNASAPIVSAPPSETKAAETAAKVLDLAHSDVAPPAPAKASNPAPVIAPLATPSIATPPVATQSIATQVAAPPPVKLIEPAKTSALPLPSLPSDEQLKIPSWLEPLARNAAIPAPVEEASQDAPIPEYHARTSAVLDEPVPDAHWLKEGLYKDPSHEDERDQELQQDVVSVKETQQADSQEQEDSADVPGLAFGTRFLDDEAQASEDGTPKSRKALFAAIAATILLAGLGGFWYTHQGVFASATSGGTTHSAPATQQPSDAQATTAANSVTAARPGGAIINQAATPAPLNTNMVVAPGRASQPTTSSPAASSVQPPAGTSAVQGKRPSLGAVYLATPTVNRTENGASANDADPSIGLSGSPAPGETNLGANFASTSGPVAPSNPIPVGGDVKSAQLVKAVSPIYPTFAKNQHISGDVKIDALIDETGKVSTMKVVSGPTLLYQAAMDALHQWKYQPATLDGKPVATHLTVTIQFHMQ